MLRSFAVATYLAFVASFTLFAAFVTGLLPARAPAGGLAASLAIDAALVAFFAVTHSVMARRSFKAWWTRRIPAAAERSAFVLVASAQLALLVWQWRPVGGAPLWHATGALATALLGAQLAGFGIALLSTFLIDHLELFGLRQAFAPRRGPESFRTPLLYRLVRHPLYLGLLIAFWCPPAMTAARLLLAIGMTAYVAVGARLEERDLLRAFGAEYRAYQRRVPMILPLRQR